MDISFIIPTYNEAKGIGETVQQFTQVRQSKYEIIISDNGSTDETCTLTRPLVQKVVTRPTDVRTTIGECRNRGAKPATGDILWFIDADVRIMDLEATADEVVHYFQKHPNTAALAIRLGIYQAEATWADRFWFGVVNVMTYVQNRILKTGGAPGDCMIIRRAAFERVHGFNPAFATSEDHDLFQRLAKLGDIGMLWHRRIEMSPRRVHRDGWGKVLWQWGRNWTKQFILHKTDTGSWEARR